MRSVRFSAAGFAEQAKGTSLLLVVCLAACWLVAGMMLAQTSRGDLQFESTSVTMSNPDGSFEHHAGAHPDLLFHFKVPSNSEMVHNVLLQLPPGFVGNPTAAPTCATSEFRSVVEPSFPQCPVGSQIGWVKGHTARLPFWVGLYNLARGSNQAARFGFVFLNVPVVLTATVRPGDYGVTSGSTNTSQTEALREAEIMLWGVPADPAHDAERISRGYSEVFPGLPPAPSEAPLRPFLRSPTSCSEQPVTFEAEGDSWNNPGAFDDVPMTADANGVPFVIEGCEDLSFNPAASVHPTSSAVDSPSGLVVDIDVPQDEAPYGRSSADVRQIVTTLPQGISVSDSSAAGLGSCSQAQIGIGSNEEPTCPESSKIGTVKIKSPLLEEELEGSVYLARQNENPFGSLLAMYVAVKGPGFYLKLPGKIAADPTTGQLTTTFSDTPQLPFEHLHLELKNGPRAPLATPQSCGTFTTTSLLTPWSAPSTPEVSTSSSFATTGCAATMPFAPTFAAGTAVPKAGAFSPFELTVKREDGEQDLSSVSLEAPKGLLGEIGSVPLCAEAQANAGSCPESSKIGTVTVAAGVGPLPLSLPQPGGREDPVYLTGPYKGGPFGLSIVTHTEAGPFNLGDVVVRASIRINPKTAQVSVLSDPIPQIKEGIPFRLRMLHIAIDRPGFMLNPTSCEQLHVTGAAGSSAGASAALSSRFAVGGCDALKFTPKFAVSTVGQASKRAGASLTTKLTYPKGPQGAQADVAKVKVALPIQLPSQLNTLQQACPASVFEANPANCPAHSIVGHAKVSTPLLSVPLTGPAYFVSHGGEEFPALTMVLQGDGVTVELVGATHIKHGITSTTFSTLPDVPFSSFELTLPQGEYAALAANLPNSAHDSFCGRHMFMPTELIAQNGLEIHENAPVTVTGCRHPAKRNKHGGKKAKRAAKPHPVRG